MVRLTADLAAAQAELRAKDEAIQAFRVHLDIDKFKGIGAGGSSNAWIATRDVLAWLAVIDAAGQEA